VRAHKRYSLPVFPRFLQEGRVGGEERGGFMIYCGFCELLLPVVMMS